MQAVDQFRDAMADAGLHAPDTIHDDGKLHRFNSSGRHGCLGGWYVLHGDGVPAGMFGDWRQGLQQSWCAKPGTDMSDAERQAHRERVQAIQAQRDAEKKREQAAVSKAVQAEWTQAPPAPADHPYLRIKCVKPHGLRAKGDALLVPMRDTDGKTWSMQTIAPDGAKRFTLGGRVRGCYYSIGKPAGVLVVAEGFATGASIHEATGHAVAVAFNAGNLKAVAQALHAKYPKLRLILAADDDWRTEGNPGVTKAREAAQAVGGAVAVPVFSEGRVEKATDFNDLHRQAGAESVRACFKGAAAPEAPKAPEGAGGWPTLQPLTAKIEPQPYPLDALPDGVRQAVQEVMAFVKAPVPLIAMSALSALSLAIQAHVDVQRAEKLTGPCGLFSLAIADSGERKSTCDGFFTKAIRDYEAECQEEAKPRLRAYRSERDAWEAKRAGLKEKIKQLAKDGKPCDGQERELAALDNDEPIPPRVPRLIYGDATPEALTYALTTQWPSGGVVSSEAGSVFGSHGMGRESVMRNLSTLNQLWDGAALSVERRTSESYVMRGARLTVALQVQEPTLRAFFDSARGLARGTGFLARFLVAWPASTQGTRQFSEAPAHWPALATFNSRLDTILRRPVSMEDGALQPVMLTLTPDAKRMWVRFHDAIEGELASGGELADVRDVASKIADNAARLAALFHTYTGSIGPISTDAMESATRIATWHLYEAQRFLGEMALPLDLANPVRLEAWLLDYCRSHQVDSVATRDIQRLGPNGLRDKAVIAQAVAELAELGRARQVQDGKKKAVQINPVLLSGEAA
ncbi:MAG: DUF3987 domain-containing protein [Burkholderiales bacterium]|nr:DUF3987 domain-containing protein [Burkholderiales bacterium]MBK8664858.1 DUF3987 domain-containing protein [Burkholderiales bacterium]